MMPKVNPRQMKRMMKRMGMETEELEAIEVTIKTADSEIRIENPSVVVVKAMGQKTYQITGEEHVEAVTAIPEEDVKLVAAQAKVNEADAREALEKTDGDLAEAIILLENKK
ncbi:MAG: nascent polypeptide-associated complex protein [Candidatus Hydrothermarchaeales archaeon]